MRSPCSVSSRATTPALKRTAVAIACSSAVASRASRASALASSQAKNAASPMAAAFTTSASPARNSRSGSVARVSMSATTATGWWKAPTRFLPSARSTAVLPPTEESTIASRVVGSCTKRTPRIQQAAANPARSPTTPPPRATTVASRLAPSAARACMSSAKRASVFSCSPAGRMKWPVVLSPNAARTRSR